MARQEGLTPEETIDCVQTALCTLLDLVQSGQVDARADPAPVLVTVVRNAARNQRRRHFRARPHVEVAALEDAVKSGRAGGAAGARAPRGARGMSSGPSRDEFAGSTAFAGRKPRARRAGALAARGSAPARSWPSPSTGACSQQAVLVGPALFRRMCEGRESLTRADSGASSVTDVARAVGVSRSTSFGCWRGCSASHRISSAPPRVSSAHGGCSRAESTPLPRCVLRGRVLERREWAGAHCCPTRPPPATAHSEAARWKRTTPGNTTPPRACTPRQTTSLALRRGRRGM